MTENPEVIAFTCEAMRWFGIGCAVVALALFPRGGFTLREIAVYLVDCSMLASLPAANACGPGARWTVTLAALACGLLVRHWQREGA